ncbi:alpha/beta hydrolase [Plebeiibacterium sediminum]|uniref:Alpha/beta hydrolase n=1 Tax=Plebeiibacterium sediminum TaxID=2992112 RepID=A0AAE3M6F2_9BACT|nr:alpha/beta hydrolase [Plebeiobacterium sediminum]MCW3787984.1 alpha/beta hydrolase [Plebeiobacterium sediminum]
MEHIKLMILGSVILLFSVSVYSQEYMPLWSNYNMPNSRGMELPRIEERERITQIDVPGMYCYFTSKEENTGSAVLIFPPGGYRKEAYNIAGIQLAKWFNTFGVNAFVVIYRLPTSPDLTDSAFGPLTDAQRAMKRVRSHAAFWNIDPERIGVMGCSAGGGLVSNLSTIQNDYSCVEDSIDQFPFVPDFQISISGAISMQQDAHEGSRNALLGENPDEKMKSLFSGELNVGVHTPPAFIACASDDPVVNPMNSLRYYQALQAVGISSCLHIFSRGKHSIALRNNPGATNLWSHLCEAWMNEMGYLTRKEVL